MTSATKFIGGPLGRWFRDRHWSGVTLPVPFYGALVLMWLGRDREWTLIELRHEVLGHVPQVEELFQKYGSMIGTCIYVGRALYQYVHYGHINAPFEIDARIRAANEHVKEDSC